MKTLTKIIILLNFLTLGSAILPTKAIAQHASVSFQLFYDHLSPYGQWVDDYDYGYVWIPDAVPDFFPYSTEGYWVNTVYGWTWASNYNWGWAPFHYGRWDYSDYYGWFWVPGNEWGPSWVVWRRSEGYYGWAPMRPGVNITVAFGPEYHIPHEHWMFVRDRDIARHNIYRYHLDRSRNVTIINQTVIINNTYEDHHRNVTYVYGPKRDEVQRVTGRNVRSYAIYDYDKPGENVRGSKIRIYRPEVQRNQDAAHKPVPARVVNSREYRRPSDRGTSNERRTYNTQDNNTREKQQRTVTQPDNNNVERSGQPRNTNQQDNTRTERQQRDANPPTNETQRSTQQRNINQPENNTRERQQRTESQSNNNVERSTQQQNTNQPDNAKTERQQRNVNQSSNERQQSTQQQNVNRSDNTGTERQTRTVNRSSNEVQSSSQQQNTNQSDVNRREERQTRQPATNVQRSSQQQNTQTEKKSEQQQTRTEKEKSKESTSRGRR